MKRILIVEDNEMNRDALSRRLRRQGDEVLIATAGLDGLKMAARHASDLILMDLGMPDIDGWECAKRRKSPATVVLPAESTAHATAEAAA